MPEEGDWIMISCGELLLVESNTLELGRRFLAAGTDEHEENEDV